MAHFAEINDKNEVIRVVVVPDEYESIGEIYLSKDLEMGGRWIQTSYNSKIRGKFAGIGDIYDSELDRFISKKPYDSWILNDEFDWVAPTSRPDGAFWEWNESKLNWVKNETVEKATE